MKTLALYLVILIPLSLLLAIFEIWLEGFKKGSWGATEFDHPLWGHKIYGTGMSRFLIRKVFGNEYLTPYHIVLFGLIIPIATIAMYAILWIWSGKNGFIITVWHAKIVPLIFIPAVWLGNMALEDFLWFAVQSLTGWREPQALHRLLTGNFVWRAAEDWFKPFQWFDPKTTVKLPKSYVKAAVLVALLFAAHYFVVCKWS